MPEIFDFLTGTPWEFWDMAAIPGDASARRYARLRGPTGNSVILMDTPQAEAAGRVAFVEMANLLNDAGLSAPIILRQSGPLMIISDLGQQDMATALAVRPDLTSALYACATDILLHLHRMPPPNLLRQTPEVAGDMVKITATHYIGAPSLAQPLADAMAQAMARLAPVADRLALRDFHAENLIWRPDQTGLHRLGLLDFQDAFVAPAGYDLVSLLRDARHDVQPDIYDAMVSRFSSGAGLDDDTFRAQLACLGAQRNLRILGVFARLARDAGKTRYLAMLPRVWAHLQSDLSHPALTALAQIIQESLPPPEQAMTAWALR